MENDDFVGPGHVEIEARLFVDHVTLKRAVAEKGNLLFQGLALMHEHVQTRLALHSLPLEFLQSAQAEFAMDGMIAEVGKECDRNYRKRQPAEFPLLMMLGPNAGALIRNTDFTLAPRG